jgi:hypothetical protein
MPIYTPGKLILSKIQQYPAVIGEEFGGGYFAGYISHTQNGNPTHALIVAPRATGATGSGYTLTTNLSWRIQNIITSGTLSDFDGVENTAAMVSAGIDNHPAAQFCRNLPIGGFTDWYLPARYEFDIAYFNLKPNTGVNATSFGINPYAVPRRDINYTTSYPSQTPLTAFQVSGSEAFVADNHWTSTGVTAIGAYLHFTGAGNMNTTSPPGGFRVRAFRRIAF